MTVKVLLETQCAGCRATLEAVRTAVNEIDATVEVESVTDVKQILSYKVWRLPALVVNEKVVSFGKNLDVKQATELIKSNSNN